jgi:hypothetical protein
VIVPIRWRVISYDAGGVPITDLTARVDAALVVMASDPSGNRTVAIGPSLVDCKGATQPLGITLEDSAHVGDLLAFSIPTLATPAAGTVSLRIYADYGAVPR